MIPEPIDIEAIFADDDLMERTLQEGVIDAIKMHKRLGNPIAVWRDGKVVWIPPEEIVVPELPPSKEP